MAQRVAQITDVLVAPDSPRGGNGPLSLGLRLDDGRIYWGDVALPSGGERGEAATATYQLRELITPLLCGQWLDSLEDLAGRARQCAGESGAAAARAVQWTYIAALLAQPDGGETLRRWYGLPNPVSCPACYLEITDFAATAERVDTLLELRPAGIGYRLTSEHVTEAIGESAEHLQRFVRDVGRRAEALAPRAGYRPAMYLGLNGALGRLAGDPVRHIGKVLGNVVGLQSASGERRLLLESPFSLADPVAQAANLHRLKDFIRRTPDSLGRRAPTQVLAPVAGDGSDAEVYVDTVAVHGLVFDSLNGEPDRLLRAVAGAAAAAVDAYWYIPAATTPRQSAATVALAVLTGATAVVASGDGGDVLPILVSRLLSEAETR